MVFGLSWNLQTQSIITAKGKDKSLENIHVFGLVLEQNGWIIATYGLHDCTILLCLDGQGYIFLQHFLNLSPAQMSRIKEFFPPKWLNIIHLASQISFFDKIGYFGKRN